tara:strand:- start:558 stop:716 length:159 start_codon:yes stop_codon:yes gene_type:complete
MEADDLKKVSDKKENEINKDKKKSLKKEFGGQDGPEPTRFGDWEKKGITSDF